MDFLITFEPMAGSDVIQQINDGLIKNAALLILERTHYDDSTIEIIAPVSIKESTGVKNGDRILITTRIPGDTVRN